MAALLLVAIPAFLAKRLENGSPWIDRETLQPRPRGVLRTSWLSQQAPKEQADRLPVEVAPEGEAVSAATNEKHLLFLRQEDAAVVV